MRVGLLYGHERVEGLAVFVTDFHHPGAPGVEVLFVDHPGHSRSWARGSLPQTRPAHEIPVIRHLRGIFREVLVGGMLRYGRFSNICGIRREGQGWWCNFSRLQNPRTSGDFGWAILGLMVSILRKVRSYFRKLGTP